MSAPAPAPGHFAPPERVRRPANRLAWGAATYGAVLAVPVLTFPACREAPSTAERPAAPTSAPSAPPAPEPPWYSGAWSVEAPAGAHDAGSGGAAALEGSIHIDDAGQASGSLRRVGATAGAPLVVRGSLLDESLRFEAASLAERALVVAERSGAGPEARFTGSLVWASVTGTEGSRSPVALTRAARPTSSAASGTSLGPREPGRSKP